MSPFASIVVKPEVVGFPDRVEPELLSRFVWASDRHFDRFGIRTQVNSAWRTLEAQWYHWNRYQAYLAGGPWAPIAAYPGRSKHGRPMAEAIDAQPVGRGADSTWQRPYLDAGLYFPVRGEPWHVELAPIRAPLPRPIPPPSEVPAVSDRIHPDDMKHILNHINVAVEGGVSKLAAGTLQALVNVARAEAPQAAYRTPNGTIYIVLPTGERLAPSPDQLGAAIAAGIVPSPIPQMTEDQARHLDSLYPLKGRRP